MHRGFTIIEIIIVVSVITVLTSIGIVGYAQYQQRSTDAQARSIAASVRSAAERYHSRNNEYPPARDTHGSTPSGCSAPTNYSYASNILAVPTNTLKQSRISLAFWATNGACGTLNKNYVYYITKAAGDFSNGNHVVNGCTYSFSSTESGATAFTIAFYSITENKWNVARSNQGTASASSGCSFTAL